jgi:crotonobetainyl-CoA:carnitine CoA-transferase CaiB-like acyl-CoA transferase
MSDSRAPRGPLDDIRVIDLTTTFMGPYATQMLAAMGADVIKVEAPEGDIVRRIGTGRNPGMGPIFLTANHGKRSIALDLKQQPARTVMMRLVDTADVFVSNLRPAALAKLGLSWEMLSTVNPGLVYCALPGFGRGGPYRDQAAYDDVIQAISGIAASQAGEGPPAYVRAAVADKTVAVMALGAITAALFQRERAGGGQLVEVPMFESMAAFTLLELQGGYVFDPPTGPTGYARVMSPHRHPYQTRDGYLGVVVYTDRQWLSFFELIGRPQLADEARFATIAERTQNIDELYSIVADTLPERTSQDWLADFERLGIPAVPVLELADLLDDPHLQAVDLIQHINHPTEGALRLARLPMSFMGTNPAPLRPAPMLGQHTLEVLRDLGIEPGAIRQLLDDGAIVADVEVSR